jgi:hypothetical protein
VLIDTHTEARAVRKLKKFKFLPLPPDFDPVDATIAEVAAYRRESEWTVHQKVRTGVYQSYLDKRIRKIVFASVKRDRERALAEGASLKLHERSVASSAPGTQDAAPMGKRPVGRPRKHVEERPALASTRRALETTS